MFRNGCDRFLHLERFRQMCIHSGGQTFLRIFFIRIGRHGNDGNSPGIGPGDRPDGSPIFTFECIFNLYYHIDCRTATLLLQHILNKNPISSGTVLHENMGDGPYEFTVLDDRCTAHSLDDSSGQGDQVRICDFQFDSPVHVVMIEMNVGDLDIIVSGGAVYGTQNLRRSLSDLLF